MKKALSLVLTSALLLSLFSGLGMTGSAAVSSSPVLSESFDYLSSDLFNFATQDMWDKGQRDGNVPISAVLNSQHVPSGSGLVNSVFFEYDGKTANPQSGYPAIHFIDNTDPGHRYSYGPLFGSADISDYNGIVIWLKRGETFEANNKRVIVMIGSMGSGGTYDPGLAKNYYQANCPDVSPDGGYYYIPFSDFKNGNDSSLAFDPEEISNLNFISFKAGEGGRDQTLQYYAADLRLYRSKQAASANEYVSSDRFNTATNEDWADNVREGRRTDSTSGEVISDIYAEITTDPAHIPLNSNVRQSLHIYNDWTGGTAYPAIHFIKDTSGTGYSGRADRPLWTEEEFQNVKGIRIWLQRPSTSIQPINIILTVAGTATASTGGSTRHFRCKVSNVTSAGEYYDIPFSDFIDYANNTPYDPEVNGIPNSIGFKSDATQIGTDYYISDLQLIRAPGSRRVGVASQLFKNLNDEILADTVKNDGQANSIAVIDEAVYPSDSEKTTPGTYSSVHMTSLAGSYPGVSLLSYKSTNVGASLGLLWEENEFAGAEGIRIWIKRGSESVKPLYIYINKYTTDITQHTNVKDTTKHPRYRLSNVSTEGEYYDIPFSAFESSDSSVKYDPEELGAPSWIGFSSAESTNSNATPMDYWVADLQFYRSEQSSIPTAEISVSEESRPYLTVTDYATGITVDRAEIGNQVRVTVDGIAENEIMANGLVKYRFAGQTYAASQRTADSLNGNSFVFTVPNGDVEVFIDTAAKDTDSLYAAGRSSLAVYGAKAVQPDGEHSSALDFSSRALKSVSYNGKIYTLASKGNILINDKAFTDSDVYTDWLADGNLPYNAAVVKADGLLDSCDIYEDYALSVKEVVEKNREADEYTVIAYGEYVNGEETVRLYSAAFAESYNEAFSKSGEIIKTMLENKRVLWIGTSIPAGTANNNYPAMVADMAGVSAMYNMAVGSSPAAAGKFDRADPENGDPLGIKNAHWQMAGYGLAQTAEEKLDILTNFSTYNFYQAPSTLTDAERVKILNTSYERRVDPYISGNGKVDIVFYNHGYNDYGYFGEENMQYGGLYSEDRSTFYGATNFILNRIKSANPDVQIIIVGHYSDSGREGVPSDRPGVNTALKAYAEEFGYPYLDIAPSLGEDFYTLFNDHVHPHKDTTGTANRKIAEAIMSELVKLNLEASPSEKGDLNGDSLINAQDTAILRKHLIGSETLSGESLEAADVNGDGSVDVKDLIRLKKLIAGIEDNLFEDIDSNREKGVFPMFGNEADNTTGGNIPDGEEYTDYNTLKKAEVTAI